MNRLSSLILFHQTSVIHIITMPQSGLSVTWISALFGNYLDRVACFIVFTATVVILQKENNIGFSLATDRLLSITLLPAARERVLVRFLQWLLIVVHCWACVLVERGQNWVMKGLYVGNKSPPAQQTNKQKILTKSMKEVRMPGNSSGYLKIYLGWKSCHSMESLSLSSDCVGNQGTPSA